MYMGSNEKLQVDQQSPLPLRCHYFGRLHSMCHEEAACLPGEKAAGKGPADSHPHLIETSRDQGERSLQDQPNNDLDLSTSTPTHSHHHHHHHAQPLARPRPQTNHHSQHPHPPPPSPPHHPPPNPHLRPAKQAHPNPTRHPKQ
ncbi:predicted protein [Plenodomus lingam JN3]|uniref:Predicted protein n=1 Tax=Leptosphaeria maculans (strain JN3 / isolate v23.1.3 / race Av1-4-5-6-7-8) TaxID=985895 RepID=E4ZTR2_LEPMJ|nr:predicted protein [Plenodomus lingam JN3]CBX94622.1 predicted protein [Plenodomus lingam JN3]